MKTLIVIPAHNEEVKIAEVIDDLNKHSFTEILVIDDGSDDKTSEIAKKSGAMVVRHVINRGLGAGLGTGFEYAKKGNYDCLITFDGDGQHQACDLARLLKPIKENKADVVIGSRMLKPAGMPPGRVFVNLVSNFATLILFRVWTTDTLSGLRAFNRKAIEAINLKTDRMEVSNEFFMEIRQKNLKFKEIAIKPVYTEYSEGHSHNLVSLTQTISNGKGMLLRVFR